MNAKDNILVILVGDSTRGNNFTHQTIIDHLIKPTNADVALCSFDDFTIDSILTKHIKYFFKFPFYKNIKDFLVNHELYNCTNLLNFFTIKNTEAFPNAAFPSFLLKHYVYENLKNISQNYSQIIFTRLDYYYIYNHPKLTHEQIHIPDCEHWGGFNDRHVVFPSSKWRDVLDIFGFIIKNYEHIPNKANSETVYKMLLEKKCELIKFFTPINFLICNKHTNVPEVAYEHQKFLNLATLPDNEHIFIKYITEAYMCLTSLGNIKDKNILKIKSNIKKICKQMITKYNIKFKLLLKFSNSKNNILNN